MARGGAGIVVYHLVPTSNHNPSAMADFMAAVVYHLVPTSNHNSPPVSVLTVSVVYHLVPTSNHNLGHSVESDTWLFIILFLHQTTTCRRA